MVRSKLAKSFAYLCLFLGLCGLPVAYCGILGWHIQYFEARYFLPTEWSPDGNWLAFGVQEEYITGEIWLIDKNGKNLTALTKNHDGKVYPGGFSRIQWSADGEQIFYETYGGESFVFSFQSNATQIIYNFPPPKQYPHSYEVQSICNHPEDYHPSILDECPNDLEVRDRAGNLIFSLNQNDLANYEAQNSFYIRNLSFFVLGIGTVSLLVYQYSKHLPKGSVRLRVVSIIKP